MHTVFLGLGTNIGDKEANIKRALELLKENVLIERVASLYISKPWGYLEQDDFLNTALRGQTILSPRELLIFVKEIEKKMGRVKTIRNGPRVIDIDILYYDDFVLNDPDLIIPHPLIHERDFVMKPLQELGEIKSLHKSSNI